MRLAVVAPWHGRHEATLPLLRRVLIESSRRPDELWLMLEDEADEAAVIDGLDALGLRGSQSAGIFVRVVPTPRDDNGRCKVIPYSLKNNAALDATEADVITYLDNGSFPDVEKYALMMEGLENNPGWGCVFVTQKRSGYLDEVHYADKVIHDGHSQVNFSQFAHRRTADRWTLDMRWADPDLADAMFLHDLSKSLGPLHPVGGLDVRDWHDMPSSAAAGI